MQIRTILFQFLCLLGGASAITASTDVPDVNGFPSPWARGGPGGWDEAYEKARAFVTDLTLVEKVNLTTGTGWESDVCVGMTGSIPRLGFRGICTQDSPLGVRYSQSWPSLLLTGNFVGGDLKLTLPQPRVTLPFPPASMLRRRSAVI